MTPGLVWTFLLKERIRGMASGWRWILACWFPSCAISGKTCHSSRSHGPHSEKGERKNTSYTVYTGLLPALSTGEMHNWCEFSSLSLSEHPGSCGRGGSSSKFKFREKMREQSTYILIALEHWHNQSMPTGWPREPITSCKTRGTGGSAHSLSPDPEPWARNTVH